MSSVSLYDEPFPRYRSVYFRRLLPWQRSRKLGRVDKNMLYGNKPIPQGPNFHPFSSTMSHFRETGLFTLDVRYHGKGHGNWDELTKTCFMVFNIPQGPNFHPFHCMMSRFRDTGPFTLDVRYHGNGHGNWVELTKTCFMVLNIPHRVQIVIRCALW